MEKQIRQINYVVKTGHVRNTKMGLVTIREIQSRLNTLLKYIVFLDKLALQSRERKNTQLEINAIVHDIGIKQLPKSMVQTTENIKNWKVFRLQKILEGLGYSEEVVERVRYLAEHHHTYNQIDGLDYQILV